MPTARQAAGSILGAVHETTRDLHNAGFIDKRRMHHCGALCRHDNPVAGVAITTGDGNPDRREDRR
ncbi:MAG: hypothetical protein COX57_09525 [Alphaproteobacteria bacterium CG_4_10_14_0_2_um_filter_63_37]|nr:MAG: hypothetical protein AUJ55_02640 [Proteobacteria bacterium CG1_02_64_396]PJA24234.1 MAG: hypothetical protein COX57_09525 [Alphaproteobacteria bacterium CG_4_10_14_0_2_um_filter_63_37]